MKPKADRQLGAGWRPIRHRRKLSTVGFEDRKASHLPVFHLLQHLAQFQPRLVGSVLTGTATNYSDINLHLFADASETVAIHLLDLGVPHEFYERRVKMDAERSVNYPALRFEANGRTVDATVFPIDGIRQSPYSPVDGRPMKRAEVEALLAKTAQAAQAGKYEQYKTTHTFDGTVANPQWLG